MDFNDNFFDKVEKKTKVNKDVILSLANKLKNNMKDESTIRDVINSLCSITGKNISEDKVEKIIKKVKDNDIPNVKNMF